MADEYLLGEITSESYYNPRAVPPTWKEYYTFLVQNGIDTHIIVPMGKLGSDKRATGSVSRKVTLRDVEAALDVIAEQRVEGRGIMRGDPSFAAQVFGEAAVIQHQPQMSARMVEVLCALDNQIVHLTGLVIKPI